MFTILNIPFKEYSVCLIVIQEVRLYGPWMIYFYVVQFGDSTGEGIDGNADALQPKGRWAQRFDQNMAFKSQLDLTQLDDEIG